MATHTYKIDGMDCAHCALAVEKGVRRLDGALNVEVNFATGLLKLDGAVDEAALRERVAALGYRVVDEAAAKRAEIDGDVGAQHAVPLPPDTPGGVVGFMRYLLRETPTQLALIGGLMLAAGFSAAAVGVPGAVIDLTFIAATLVALYPIARGGVLNLLINRDFNINLLMSIAAVGALLIGETAEAATVIFLFAIGEALEGYSSDRARGSIQSLMSLAPPTALRLHNGREQNVPVTALNIGDVVLVRAGERIPMDGEVVAGESGVDQAPITGESVPVHKAVGDGVYAGTINGSGALEIRVTQRAADNTLSRIIRLVEEAQSVRAPSQRLIDQFARVYTPAVVIAAAVVAVVPPLLFNAPFYDTPDTHGWLYRALALLVIACPCALVISTPVTVISAIAAAARRGVLIKGGAHLEALAGIRAAAFDKTGTLTYGKPVVQVAQSVDCSGEPDCDRCDDLLALAAAVERRSAHPLARAVVEAAEGRGLMYQYAPAESVETLTGQGVQGRVGDRLVTVGNHALFEAAYPHARALCAQVEAAEAQGQTTMLLSDGERVRGFIGVADAVRPDSREAVRALNSLGMTTVMLTGDNRAVAESVGAAVGVLDVRAGLLPGDKAAAVESLRRQYGTVAMVGDGINDAPALATATVGIAMGGAGSAQALETAHVALMADDLSQLPFAVRLARFARAVIAQNIAFSLAVKLVFVVLALFGVTSLWVAVFADMGTSLLVTLNGVRPLRLK
jgi:Cd2+/Zn2+-exporting ATPase